jgi:hypothetical protein
MPNNPSRLLSQKDKDILAGFSDIYRPEPDQLLPEAEAPKTPAEKLLPIREKAVTVSERIELLKEKVDKKCNHLSVSTGEPPGSNLFQAMWRLFRKETTDITYGDYKQAVILRQQLGEEDRAEKGRQERARRDQDGLQSRNVYPMG